jgi:hypothetical protein
MERRHVNAGSPAEILTMARILERGWTVSLPYGGKAGYDLLADTGTQLLRIQVKTIYLGNFKNRSRWVMDFLKPKNRGHKWIKYSKADCDYIVGMCPENSRCFVFPVENCASRRQASFDFGGTPLRKSAKIKWAMSYEDAWPE